jgi:hypothetical protein
MYLDFNFSPTVFTARPQGRLYSWYSSMATTSNLTHRQPRIARSHFASLCATPTSYHEAALREHIFGWMKTRGIAAIVDGWDKNPC